MRAIPSVILSVSAINFIPFKSNIFIATRIGTFMEDILGNPKGPSHSLGAGISVIEKDLFPLTARYFIII